MKRTIRIATISTAAAFAACFGAGPVPPSPDNATLIFGVPPPAVGDSSCLAYFIGDVALGSDAGYAAVIPYGPQSCGGGGAIAPRGESIRLFQFHPDGAAPAGIGEIPVMGGMQFVPLPRVAIRSTGPIWARASLTGSPGIYLGSGGSADELLTASVTNNFVPAGLAVGSNDTVYVAEIPEMSFRAIDSPSYPCCGMGGATDGSGIINTFHPNGTGTAVKLACSTTDRCLASSADALYFFEQDAGANAFTVHSMTKAGGTLTKVADGPSMGPASAPAGIAISGTRMVWTSTVHFEMTTTSGCTVTSWDLATMTPGPTWSATQFSCLDVAVDGDQVYFAIVHPDGTDPMSDENLHGDGIGRLDLATMDFASVDTGIAGRGFGPRRVFVDATYVYAVDPQVIARIPRASIDGHHDFTP